MSLWHSFHPKSHIYSHHQSKADVYSSRYFYFRSSFWCIFSCCSYSFRDDTNFYVRNCCYRAIYPFPLFIVQVSPFYRWSPESLKRVISFFKSDCFYWALYIRFHCSVILNLGALVKLDGSRKAFLTKSSSYSEYYLLNCEYILNSFALCSFTLVWFSLQLVVFSFLCDENYFISFSCIYFLDLGFTFLTWLYQDLLIKMFLFSLRNFSFY